MRPRFLLALCLVLGTRELAAQNVDVFARAIETTKEGHTTVHGGEASVFLNEARGYEAGVDVWWTEHLSTELSVASTSHDLDAAAFGESVDLGATRAMPWTGVLLFHSNRQGWFDFHAGAGASYVTFKDVTGTAELALVGVRSIHFHNSVAPVVDAGIAIRFSPRLALTADAKWTNIDSRTTATYLDDTTEAAKLKMKQVTVGAGLELRF